MMKPEMSVNTLGWTAGPGCRLALNILSEVNSIPAADEVIQVKQVLLIDCRLSVLDDLFADTTEQLIGWLGFHIYILNPP